MVEFRLGDVEHRLVAMGRARVVDDDVERAERIQRERHQRRHVGVACDVATAEAHGEAGAGQRVGHAPSVRLVDVGDHHARALVCEALGDTLAKAGAAARDDRHLAFESHVRRSFPRVSRGAARRSSLW
jgi:hypothetical protein